MSELFVVIRPELLYGFQLAGVQTYAADDVETAEELIQNWLDEGQGGLVAIDDGLLSRMRSKLLNRLRRSNTLFHIAIPGGEPLGEEYTRKHRLAEMIRQSVGFHITFDEIEEAIEE